MTDFEVGRYVYCVVDPDRGDALQERGIDGGEVRLVTAEGCGVAAVVQTVESLFDSADEETLTRWFLQHQRVVDEADAEFGTPVPFRFDTILQGGDDRVCQWLREQADELSAALDDLARHAEYRIELRHDEEALSEAVADDEQLSSLDERREDANEGTAYLLEKQYSQREAELKRERHASVAVSLTDRLEAYVREYEQVQDDGTSLAEGDEDHDGPSTKFAILAPQDAEGAVGEVLDDIAANDGVEIRFTGPWAPYTFTAGLGGDRGAHSGR